MPGTKQDNVLDGGKYTLNPVAELDRIISSLLEKLADGSIKVAGGGGGGGGIQASVVFFKNTSQLVATGGQVKITMDGVLVTNVTANVINTSDTTPASSQIHLGSGIGAGMIAISLAAQVVIEATTNTEANIILLKNGVGIANLNSIQGSGRYAIFSPTRIDTATLLSTDDYELIYTGDGSGSATIVGAVWNFLIQT